MFADDTNIYFNLESFESATNKRDLSSELDKINICKTLSVNVSCNLQWETKTNCCNHIVYKWREYWKC